MPVSTMLPACSVDQYPDEVICRGAFCHARSRCQVPVSIVRCTDIVSLSPLTR